MRSAFAAALIAFAPIAASAVARDVPVGLIGWVQVEADGAWHVGGPSSKTGALASYESRVPGRFQFLMTPVPVNIKPLTDREVEAAVQRAATKVGPGTVEKTLIVVPLQGGEARGYYFKATDADPRPREYRFMYQGMVVAGRSLTSFTVLYNAGGEKDADMALAAMRGLRYKAKSP